MAGRRAAVAGKLRIAAIFAAGVSGLSACAPIDRSHGYVPTEADLQEIVVGVDTRDTVEEVVGPPSASGVVGDDAWFYVQTDWRSVAYRAPEPVDRQLVAISFAPDGTVRNIERFGLEDGRVIALNRRITDSNVEGVSFIRQLLGNVGNFSPQDVMGN